MQVNSGSVQVSQEPLAHGGQAVAAASLERRLMERVFDECNAVICEVCRPGSVPPEFLGALTANESGGRRDATRFEPGVYRHLQAVASGRRAAYGRLTAGNLGAEVAELLPSDAALHARYLTTAFSSSHQEHLSGVPDEVLRELSTSWGYTQIMGYHMVGRAGTMRDLVDPPFHYRLAVRLLSGFAADFRLDLRMEFAELFRCWNTGRPNGKTFDSNYVQNGLRRIEIYRRLQAGETSAR